ncbi:MAG: hypothetical protein H9855_13785 [Candidatus Acinetobacter avistercoris]|uniref:hypothetical protein n=1 Tax=Acinetobacter sp. KS-LM10 TaxID=3120518 RepID=UPI001FA604EF|nr:hypothetical protein [Candidatus Acinetobacter avistercoris]
MEIYQQVYVCFKRLSLTALILASTSVLAKSESEQFLESQRVNENRVTVDLIEKVQSETKKPVEVQLKNNQSLADKQFNQIKQQNLEESAVSDYELKRQTDPVKLMNNEKQEYIPARNASVVYKLQYENKNVQIGTNINR